MYSYWVSINGFSVYVNVVTVRLLVYYPIMKKNLLHKNSLWCVDGLDRFRRTILHFWVAKCILCMSDRAIVGIRGTIGI